MITTTSIHQLQEHDLLQGAGPFTNEQIINAAAILAYKNGCKKAESLHDAIWDECDMSMRFTLKEMDKKELLEYAKTHS